METLTNPHWEALTPETQDAFHRLAGFEWIHKFYLAGGTGLALHLGHRFSIDQDFFSQDPEAVDPTDRVILREALDDPSLLITSDKDATFIATWRGVGISFFRLNQYPLVKPPCQLDGVRIASIDEIGDWCHETGCNHRSRNPKRSG